MRFRLVYVSGAISVICLVSVINVFLFLPTTVINVIKKTAFKSTKTCYYLYLSKLYTEKFSCPASINFFFVSGLFITFCISLEMLKQPFSDNLSKCHFKILHSKSYQNCYRSPQMWLAE